MTAIQQTQPQPAPVYPLHPTCWAELPPETVERAARILVPLLIELARANLESEVTR